MLDPSGALIVGHRLSSGDPRAFVTKYPGAGSPRDDLQTLSLEAGFDPAVFDPDAADGDDTAVTGDADISTGVSGFCDAVFGASGGASFFCGLVFLSSVSVVGMAVVASFMRGKENQTVDGRPIVYTGSIIALGMALWLAISDIWPSWTVVVLIMAGTGVVVKILADRFGGGDT
jgi:hypothetical protein